MNYDPEYNLACERRIEELRESTEQIRFLAGEDAGLLALADACGVVDDCVEVIDGLRREMDECYDEDLKEEIRGKANFLLNELQPLVDAIAKIAKGEP